MEDAITSNAPADVSGAGSVTKKNSSWTDATIKITTVTRVMERPVKKRRHFVVAQSFVYKPSFIQPVSVEEQGRRGLFRPPILEFERPCGHCEETDCDWCMGLFIR